MKIHLPIKGFEGRHIILLIRLIRPPTIQVDGEFISGKNGVFIIRDNTGNEVTIKLKKNWVDSLPRVEIDEVPFPISSTLHWYDYLFIGIPLALAIPGGLFGGLVGLFCSLLSLRALRSQHTPMAQYALSSCLSILIPGLLLFSWVNNSSALFSDDSLTQEIEGLIDGIQVPWNENNILYAMQLDQQGRKLMSQGKDQEVYDIYRKVLAISYKQGSLQGIMNSLGGLSSVFQNMDNVQEAIKAAHLAYKIGLLMNDPYEYGLLEMRLANLLGQENRRVGLVWRMRAKKSLKGTPYRHDYVGLLNDIAHDLQRLSLKEEARKIYEEAYSLAQNLGQSLGHRRSKWDVALNYGRMLKKEGSCEQAVDVIQPMVPTFNPEERQSRSYSYLLKELADCYAKLDKQDLAEEMFLHAYASYEIQRGRVLGDHARAKLDDNHIELINSYVNHLIDQEKSSAALSLLETNKARTLSDIREDKNQKTVYAQLISQERTQADQIQNMAERWKQEKAEGLDTKDHWNKYLQLVSLQRDQRQKLHRQLQIRNVAVSKTMTEQDIRALQSELGVETAVLAYFVSKDRIGIFLLTDKGVQYIPTTLSYAEYNRTIDQLRLALSNDYTDFYRDPSRLLYDQLVRPVKQQLSRTVKHIVYSPDDTLFYIPLGVLHDGTQFLTEQYALTRIPSLRFFNPETHLAATKLNKGISCADPAINGRRLPFQQETNHVLKTLYKQNLISLVDTQCSPKQLEASVNSTSAKAFLHIGAHGTFYEPDPMQSGIALSSGKSKRSSSFWNARAMANLDFSNIKLVTLSSCETGLKDYDRLRDVFGIMRGLFFGGAHQVMAPLWSVQDRATAQLIQTFYTAMAKNGRADVSLQHAQQSMIHHGKFQHPFYWAGFVLTGGPA